MRPPARLLLTLAAMVFGGYGISIGQAVGWYGHEPMLLLLVSWYAASTGDGLVTLMGQRERWPRYITGLLATACFSAGAFAAWGLRDPRLELGIVMAIWGLPCALHAATSYYPLTPGGRQ